MLSRFYTDYNGSTLPSDDLFPNVLENRYEIPRERTGEVIGIIKKNAHFAGAIIESEDGKSELHFSDTGFPLSTEATVRPGGDGAEIREGIKPEASPISFDGSFEKACFVITPLGAEDSNERKHADTVLRHLIEPVLKETNITAIRADQISKPGIITKQIIEHIAYARLCIADLSFK